MSVPLWLSGLLASTTWAGGQEIEEASPPAVENPADTAEGRRRDDTRAEPPRVHDPSTILRCGDKYWLFCTGQGIPSYWSTDLVHWERGPSLWSSIPAWVREVVPDHRGYFWAPDVIRIGDRYFVYYSVSSFGKQDSAIAAASSASLDPEDSAYGWTDHGIVVRTAAGDDHNAIDPGLLLTNSGELWMAYGSFWSGLKLVQLDPQTGMRKDDAPERAIAWQEQIEAPALVERDGFFYLFVNWGWCCRGVDSTYNIRVGRSRNITGPYFDRDGVDLMRGGGTRVLESQPPQIGPGHASFLRTESGWRMAYHFYDANARGRPRLGIRPLTWTADGWPQIEGVLP